MGIVICKRCRNRGYFYALVDGEKSKIDCHCQLDFYDASEAFQKKQDEEDWKNKWPDPVTDWERL